MAKYILLEDAIAALRGRLNANSSPAQRQMIKIAAAEMMRSATVDVEPVVHGRWVDNGVPDSMLSACSVCNFDTGAYTFRYCPRCGARMDTPSNLADLKEIADMKKVAERNRARMKILRDFLEKGTID